MKPEDKQLLLQDLCARLPFQVKCKITYIDVYEDGSIKKTRRDTYLTCDVIDDYIEGDAECKPYLRPMSSMTEEEKREIYDWLVENDVDWFDFSKLRLDEILISFDSSWLLINWLNAHHFDYRGLIGKGLAIEVTEDNNPYKN